MRKNFPLSAKSLKISLLTAAVIFVISSRKYAVAMGPSPPITPSVFLIYS